MNIASKLASFEDPIKSIMPVSVHKTNRIIVKRKYVVGGAASIVPERSAARTVAVREDEREIMLTRYGADLEMNLNLFLEPDAAKEELQMKLDAQRQELENTMVRLGYEAVMKTGTNLTYALARTSPAMSGLTERDQQLRIDKMYMHSIFGALAKHEFPIQNLLAAASRAGVYMPSRSNQAVMIIPPSIALSKYTRESSMTFAVSGLNVADNKVEVPLSGVVVDPVSNVKIMVHVPPPTNGPAGAAFPRVTDCGLMNVTSWGTFYPMDLTNGIKITDFEQRTTATLTGTMFENSVQGRGISLNSGKYQITDPAGGTTLEIDKSAMKTVADAMGVAKGTEVEPIFIRPKMTCAMMSAILCTQPGSGELLMAYPQTGVSTSQTLETMRMQLRVYLGAAVYNNDHYIVIPDVAFDGIVSGHSSKVCTDSIFNPDTEGLIAGFKTKGTDYIDIFEDPVFKATIGDTFYKEYYELKDNAGNIADDAREPEGNYPVVLYQGRTWDASGNEKTANMGHLEHLDDPQYSDVLDGLQKFTSSREVRMP
jgi:hypothetical protein